MNRFTPLFSQVVDSSIWDEEYFVRVLWMTLLAKKDSDHIVRGTAYQISRWANMSEKEVLEGMKVLSSPDKKRIEPQPFEGRRVERVEEGWLVLNGQKYEELMKKIAEQARKARWARNKREKERSMAGFDARKTSGTMAERNELKTEEEITKFLDDVPGAEEL